MRAALSDTGVPNVLREELEHQHGRIGETNKIPPTPHKVAWEKTRAAFVELTNFAPWTPLLNLVRIPTMKASIYTYICLQRCAQAREGYGIEETNAPIAASRDAKNTSASSASLRSLTHGGGRSIWRRSDNA